MLSVAVVLGGLTSGSASQADAKILFARGTTVPSRVQDFAWRVVETRCRYGLVEFSQRSFWAYDTDSRQSGESVIHSIKILSESTWKRTEPPTVIELTVVDDGRLRVASLTSSFSACSS